MRRARWIALFLLTAIVFAPATAHAEVIDFDPRIDEVPEILPDSELEKWETLRGRVYRHGITGVSPDGAKALVSISLPEGQGGLQVLDTQTKSFSDFDLQGWGLRTSLLWTGDQQAIAWGQRGPGNDREYAIVTLDLGAGSVMTETATMPEGSFAFGRTLMRDTEGNVHVSALNLESAGEIVTVEERRYEADTAPRIDAMRQSGVIDVSPTRIAQGSPVLGLLRLSDGLFTELGSIPPGTSLGYPLNTLAMRPGHDVVAWVNGPSIPWAGEVINGRGNRGGGMPTGYLNVQENLGNIPEDQNPWITRTTLHLHDLSTDEQAVIDNLDHTPGRFVDVIWTADGEHLLVEAQRPSVLEGRDHPIYEYAAGAELKRFTPAGEYVETWSRPGMDAANVFFKPLEGTKLVVMYGQDTTRHVAIVDVADPSAEPEPVYTGDDMLFGWDYAGGSLVAVLGSAAEPGELFLGRKGGSDAVDANLEMLSDNNADMRQAANLSYTNIPFATSDGMNLVATYIYPADWTLPPESPQPVVVWQAGGPGGQMYNLWGSSVESPYTLLPAYGIPVLMVNGAGRLSNGADHYSAMADGTNFGQRDIREAREAVNVLVELGYVDAERVGVTGCSYGGYFSLQSVTEDPDFYAAANSQCSLNDMMYEYHFGWSPFIAYLIGASPTSDPQEYIKDSPTYNAHKIRTPLLQFHGTNDFLFFEHITNIHDQVETNDVPSRFLRAIGYGHGLGGIRGVEDAGTKGQKFAFQLQLEWFRNHLEVPGGFLQAVERATELLAPIMRPGQRSPILGGGR